MGKFSLDKANDLLKEGGIPNYLFPDEAVNTFKTMVNYHRWVKAPKCKYKRYQVNKDRVRNILNRIQAGGYLTIGESDARLIINAYGFEVPVHKIAETSDQALNIADELGYPVVMKIVSPDILHKSDIGGVKLGIINAKDAKYNFQKIINNAKRYFPHAKIHGVAIQRMEQGGKEIIIGMNYDQQFGHLVMFGIGGIYVEVLKDVSFRIAPVCIEEAASMVREIRSFPLLRGVRGEKTVDIKAIEESILKLSQLVTDFPEIVEADINPLMVRTKGQGAIALDARFTLRN